VTKTLIHLRIHVGAFKPFRRYPDSSIVSFGSHLKLARFSDGRGVLVLDSTSVASAGLDGTDDAHRLDIGLWDLAEDDVLAIEPRGDNCGDEELGAVAGDFLARVAGGWLQRLTCWGRRWP
jgi:hypothetical protein